MFFFSIDPFIWIFGIFAQNGGETCANATVIPSIPYQATRTTIGAADDYFASCQDVGNPGGAVDVVYEYTNGATAVYIDISVCQAITNYAYIIHRIIPKLTKAVGGRTAGRSSDKNKIDKRLPTLAKALHHYSQDI